MEALWDSWLGFLTRGGFMMVPLVAISLTLGATLAWRAQTLNKELLAEAKALARHSLERNLPHRKRWLDDAFFPLSERLRGGKALVMSLVTLAPMAGLLGTVTGMIEMFDSLATNTFLSQTGGIAAGISQAMFTTEIGLVIAVPGLIVGRLLDQKENRIRSELQKLREEITP